MPFARLVEASRTVARRGKRLDKIETLRGLIQSLEKELLGAAVEMLSGIIPGGKIGVGYATLKTVKAQLGDHRGSLEQRDEQRSDPAADPKRFGLLTISDVLESLERVRNESGPGSKKRRQAELVQLFGLASADEQDFLIRLFTGELRQGALAGIMVEALSRAANVDGAVVRRAVMLSGDLSAVAVAAIFEGEEALKAFRVEVFRPLQPMLASPVDDIPGAFERIPAERMAAEIKMDGARVQVHRKGDDVRVYSRQLNDVTASVPEIVEVALAVDADEFVVDGEAYAIRKDGSIHSFQTTMRRFGRYRDVSAQRKKLPLEVRFFDLLHLNSKERIDAALSERWETLATLFSEHQPMRATCRNEAQAQAAYDAALEAGHEGLMLKDLESSYEAGSRGFSWLKLKPTHTLDLVVLAVEPGSGRRRGWLSNLHLGALDESSGEFVMLGKTFKGLTDEMLRWQTKYLSSIEVQDSARPDSFVHTVEPKLVVEIAFNNIQESPHYPAGMALRFARVKAHRPDKDAAQASTLDEVRGIFRQEHGRLPKLGGVEASGAPDASSNP